MAEIGVVHLVWVPLGLEPLHNFLSSYKDNRGDTDHDLIVVFNGFRTSEELEPFEAKLEAVPHIHMRIWHFNQDIASYYQVVMQYHYRYFCFLNSYCQLLDCDWLAKLTLHVRREGVGLVGAT